MALKVCRVARDIYVDPTMDAGMRRSVEEAIGIGPIDGRFIKKDQIITVKQAVFTKVNAKWSGALVEFSKIIESDLT